MARINLNLIAQELEKDGWKVTSEEYVNLDTEMTFQCSEGHTVYSTWRKIRQKRVCPVCENNQLKNSQTTIEPKKSGVKRVLAFDQATHITGFAVFDAGKLVRYGLYEASGKDQPKRFHQINVWFMSMIQNWNPDIVAIEGTQLQDIVSPQVFQSLSQLQGVLIETCTQLNVPLIICHTATWRAYNNVKGKNRAEKKASMQDIVKQLYDVRVTDDCADAIGIGRYAANKYKTQTEIQIWE